MSFRRLRNALGAGLAATVLASAGLVAATPSWTARVWQASDGLTDNRVTGVVQTPDGYLWVATLGKLVRFNGTAFEEFMLSTVPGVTGYGPRAMYSDRHGNLWLQAQREKLLCVGASTVQVFDTPAEIPSERLSGLAEDGEGTVWLAFGAQVYRVDGSRVRPLETPEGGYGGGRVSIVGDRQHVVWCAWNGRVGVLRGGKFEERFQFGGLDLVLGMAQKGGVWACAGNRLFRIGDEASHAPYAQLPVGVRPSAMIEDSTGAVWVGTTAHGMFRCDGRVVEQVETSHLQISSLLEDREGSIWVGTLGGGLNRLRPRALELIGPRVGPPFESVVSVSLDADDRLWAAAGGGELIYWDGKSWSAFPKAGNAWSAPSTCVSADRQGRLWVGTQGQGLREVNLRGGQVRAWTQANGLPSEAIRSLLVATDDSLWFATDGPARLCHLSHGRVETLAPQSEMRSIRAIVQNARGEVWIGTSDGQVLRVAGDSLVSEPSIAAASKYSVRCLHPTADGSLWIGYADQGIGWFKDGRFSRLTTDQGLTDNSISQIVADSQGALWVASSRGLYRIALDEALAVAEGRKTKLLSARFGREEGLPNPQVHCENAPAVCQRRDGRILFSTSLGVMALNPGSLRSNPVPPPVVLERVTMDDRVAAVRDCRFPLRGRVAPGRFELASLGETLRLPPDHRRLAFEFGVLSYAATENIRVRYRLDGFDEAWVELGRERSALYPRLPAGRYNFRVLASNDAGVWNETGASLGVIVSPFFWQTWWFRMGVLLIFTATVIAIVRFVSFQRLRSKLRLAEQRAALLQERTRIARDIHDDLGGSLAHIKLLSEFAAQNQAAPDATKTQLRQITAKTQQMLKSLDETIWAVNPRNDTLADLISYMGKHAVEFLRAAGLPCRLDLPDNPPEIPVTSEVRHHIFLTVKEALTNVVRHSAARNVLICATIEDAVLRVIIEDNGQGFDCVPDDALADGIRNMRQRVSSVGGTFRIESRTGIGTRIELAVAVRRSR